jgi:hypothetical protein
LIKVEEVAGMLGDEEDEVEAEVDDVVCVREEHWMARDVETASCCSCCKFYL